MPQTLTAPATYTQGPAVLSDPATYRSLGGTTALVLGGTTALNQTIDRLKAGLDGAGIAIETTETGVDRCTIRTIESLTDSALDHECDLVIGVGGGAALDTSKAVAHHAQTDLATIPSIASSDAPCSRLAVLYEPDGSFDSYLHRDRNPDLVAVDTQVIATAPSRFLRHGMGDALATRFEAEAAATTHTPTVAGGAPTTAALVLARTCFSTLEEYGSAALVAVSQDAVTPAVERIVEATVLLSGIGFESGGLAAAHAFHKGFAEIGSDAPHGLLVGFGTIAQLVLEGDQDRLAMGLSVAIDLDLAPPLSDLGVTTDGEIETIAARACEQDTTMAGEPMPVTPDQAADALRTADKLLTDRLA